VEEAGGKAGGPASGEEDEEEADIPGECGCCYGNGWEWYGLVVWMGVRWVGVVGQCVVGSSLGAMRSAAAPAAGTAEEAGGKADQPGSGEEDEEEAGMPGERQPANTWGPGF
jgi:hypothetical protein